MAALADAHGGSYTATIDLQLTGWRGAQRHHRGDPVSRPAAPAAARGGQSPILRRCPACYRTGDGPSLDAHFRRWGQMPGGGVRLIDEVERAGLRGRGGAGFPTATKLRTVAAARRSIVVANGTEGEPASSKDKALLVGSPHLVLDGLSIAAETVGAGEAIICVDAAATSALKAVTAALAERQQVDADRVPIRVEATPSGYVTGEESALVHWLNGGEAKPTFVPPRPFERGVRGRPTLVNNVETLAHLALIARFGADWYRSWAPPTTPAPHWSPSPVTWPARACTRSPSASPWPRCSAPAGGTGQPQAVLIGGYAGSLDTRPDRRPDHPGPGVAGPGQAPAWAAGPSPSSAPAPAACAPRPTSPPGWPTSPPASAGPASTGCPPSPTRWTPWSAAIEATVGRNSCAAGWTWSKAGAPATTPTGPPAWCAAP